MEEPRAGDFRQVATFERETVTVNPVNGYRTKSWAEILSREPARFIPGPGREYLAADAVRSSVDGRIEVRYHAGTRGISSNDRVVMDGMTWAIKAPPLMDPTLRRVITFMVAREPNSES